MEADDVCRRVRLDAQRVQWHPASIVLGREAGRRTPVADTGDSHRVSNLCPYRGEELGERAPETASGHRFYTFGSSVVAQAGINMAEVADRTGAGVSCQGAPGVDHRCATRIEIQHHKSHIGRILEGLEVRLAQALHLERARRGRGLDPGPSHEVAADDRNASGWNVGGHREMLRVGGVGTGRKAERRRQ